MLLSPWYESMKVVRRSVLRPYFSLSTADSWQGEQVAAATLIAANQGVWLRQRGQTARPLPAPLQAMHTALGEDFPPLIEDRALEGELRLCLQRIRAQHWGLYA